MKELHDAEGLIRFKKILIPRTTFIINNDIDFDGEIGIKLNNKIKVSEFNKNDYLILLESEIYSSKSNHFNLQVDIEGYFELHEEFNKLDQTMRDQVIKKNTLAILFPYLRSYVSTITAQSGMDPILLPTININAMMDKKSKYS